MTYMTIKNNNIDNETATFHNVISVNAKAVKITAPNTIIFCSKFVKVFLRLLISNFIFNVIKIIGISQMFKQKSLGFILYIVFNIIHTGFILYSYFNGSEQNQLILLFALLSVVFIILVTTNKDKVMNQ